MKAGILIPPELPVPIRMLLHTISQEIPRAFPGAKTLLFGSYAKGSYNAQSDIDLAVFLPVSYKGRALLTMFRELCRLTRKYDADIQPQLFFEDEFENPAGIVEEVVEYGIDISAMPV